MILEYKGYVGRLDEIGDDGRFYGVVANLERVWGINHDRAARRQPRNEPLDHAT